MLKPEADIGVSVVTYNHAPFIAETLDSILGQETDFSMVVHVSDDGSTDGTQDILASYAERFPNTIRARLNGPKLGIRDNFMSTIESCQTRYIAICDGDDLWTSPNKLEFQVGALEERPDFFTCFHATQVVDREGRHRVVVPQTYQRGKDSYDIFDLLKHESFFATSSIVFRKPRGAIFPEWFQELGSIVDLPLNMTNALRGPMFYIDEIMALYRSNSTPHSYTAQDPVSIHADGVQLYKVLRRNLDGSYAHQLQSKEALCRKRLIVEFLARRQLSKAHEELATYASWATSQEEPEPRMTARRLRAVARLVPLLPQAVSGRLVRRMLCGTSL